MDTKKPQLLERALKSDFLRDEKQGRKLAVVSEAAFNARQLVLPAQ